MNLTERQQKIIEIVKQNEPITGDNIAKTLGLTKSTLRSDLAVLTMTGILDARPKVGYIYSGLDFEPMLQDKLSALSVQDIMQAPVLIKQDTSVQDAVTALFMYDVGTLYISNDQDELVGVLSRKDLLRSTMMGNHSDAPVAVIMTRMPNIFVTYPDVPVLKAAKSISRHQIDSLPVLASRDSKTVVGKISKTVLVNLLIELTDKEQNA
ncbi:helix-turn-helix transcriptional regulator [Fundicoccus culcitae]|uniref:Helix-turn-helix transcriptional regulator n=1 Tax=Fundicoccus culcitae TaxID=2969821 RepID=A0ABY5P8K2_9LACT|nr:helix-turn-helix transcriptional regulator [Fundicoccus culcitae]UUX34999.1 helix-turn-helix transcriptional regulator [Fundicoccus culcitae]